VQTSTPDHTSAKQAMTPQLVVVSIFWLGLLLVASWVKPDYSHMSQYISEINATGTTAAGVLGWVGFVPFAIVVLSFLVSARSRVRVEGISALGYALLFFYPFAYLGAALAPCDAGCPIDGSASQTIHNWIGILSYLGFAAGTLLLAFTPRAHWVLRIVFVLLAIIIGLGFFIMPTENLEPVRGAIQRYLEIAQLAVFWLLLGITGKHSSNE